MTLFPLFLGIVTVILQDPLLKTFYHEYLMTDKSDKRSIFHVHAQVTNISNNCWEVLNTNKQKNEINLR